MEKRCYHLLALANDLGLYMHIPALSEDMLLNDDTRDGVEEHKSKKSIRFH